MKPKSNPLRIVQLVFLLTAAVWLGGAVFFTFVAGPMFFAPDLAEVLPKPRDGLVAQALIHRFTAFQLSLAVIAMLTLLVGWRLEGGAFPRARVLLLAGLVALIVRPVPQGWDWEFLLENRGVVGKTSGILESLPG